MDDRPLTYGEFHSRANREVFGYALKQGHLGPLVFVWVLGAAVLWLLDNREFVLFWTIVILALGYGMFRSYLGNPRVREGLLRSALDGYCLARESWDSSVWASGGIKKSAEILVASALLIDEVAKRYGPDPDLLGAFNDACCLFWLQYSLAKHAAEIDRNMRMVEPTYLMNAMSAGVDAEATRPAGSAPRNPTPIEELAAEVHARVDEVAQQLGAFLQALQELKEQTSQLFQLSAADLARETAEVLARLQARVNYSPNSSS